MEDKVIVIELRGAGIPIKRSLLRMETEASEGRSGEEANATPREERV